MASTSLFSAAITTTFVVLSTLASPSQIPTTSSLLPNPPLSSYSDNLPPDIAPLFPSTGGAAYSPEGSTMPTIPSSPNPGLTGSTGLDTAFGPANSLQDSSAVAQVLGFEGVLGFLITFWLVLVFIE